MWKIRQATFFSPSGFAVEKKKEKKIMDIAKRFALHASAKRYCVNAFAALIFDLTSTGFIFLKMPLRELKSFIIKIDCFFLEEFSS